MENKTSRDKLYYCAKPYNFRVSFRTRNEIQIKTKLQDQQNTGNYMYFIVAQPDLSHNKNTNFSFYNS